MLNFLKNVGWALSWPFMAIWVLIQYFSTNTAAKRYQKDPTCADPEERYNKIKRFIRSFLYWKHIKVEVEGDTKIKNKVMLYVANHKSNVDAIALLKVVLDNQIPYLSFVAKKELLATKIGNIATFIDTIFLDRNNLRSIVKTINEEVDLIQKENRSLCIFPEGTRVKSHKFGEFKPGALEAAYQTYASIQPVVIYNSLGLLDKEVKHSGKKIVKISFLNPINSSTFTKVDKTIFSKNLQKQMYEEYVSLRKKDLEYQNKR